MGTAAVLEVVRAGFVYTRFTFTACAGVRVVEDVKLGSGSKEQRDIVDYGEEICVLGQ